MASWDAPAHTATKLITPPTVEPFTVDEAKLHTRISDATEDANVANWIRAARTKVERDTGRALLTQTWDLFVDRFYQPGSFVSDFGWPRYAPRAICLPYPPLQSVTSVYQTDTNGAETVWTSTNYIVDTASQPGRVALSDTGAWPSGLRAFQPGRVRFVAGWTEPELIPDDLRQAVLLLIGWFSENREPLPFETEMYEALISNHVVFQAA